MSPNPLALSCLPENDWHSGVATTDHIKLINFIKSFQAHKRNVMTKTAIHYRTDRISKQARILEKWIKFWVEWTFFKTCVTCYATCPILAGATPVGAAMLFFARLVAPRPPAGPPAGRRGARAAARAAPAGCAWGLQPECPRLGLGAK